MVASGRSWAKGRLPGLGPQGQRPGASEAPEAGEALGGRDGGGAGCGMWARGGLRWKLLRYGRAQIRILIGQLCNSGVEAKSVRNHFVSCL